MKHVAIFKGACLMLVAAIALSGCRGPICGNGVKEAGEQCDDGNLMDGDGCSSTCMIE